MSTAIGVVLVLSWPVGLITSGLWLTILLVTRYASLAALVSAAAVPVLMHFLADPQKTELAILLTALVWLRHAGNIRRLVRGEESKVGQPK